MNHLSDPWRAPAGAVYALVRILLRATAGGLRR